jgi:PleD family two-component response regulator
LIDEVGALGAKIFGERTSLGLSIGISRWPEGVTSAANLLRSADAAMHVAKRTSKDRYHLGKRPEYLAETHATSVNGTNGATSLLSEH